MCRRRGLAADLATDLVHDAWVRIDEAFSRRTEPYSDLDDDVAAERFARRVLSNLAIDRSRSMAHRTTVASSDSEAWESSGVAPWSAPVDEIAAVESRDAAFRLRRSVAGRVESQLDPCPGCPGNVVGAVALFVCNALACGLTAHDGGGNVLDGLIYEGLRTHDPANFATMKDRPSDAQRKRKSRCSSCIVGLLRECAMSIGWGVS